MQPRSTFNTSDGDILENELMLSQTHQAVIVADCWARCLQLCALYPKPKPTVCTRTHTQTHTHTHRCPKEGCVCRPQRGRGSPVDIAQGACCHKHIYALLCGTSSSSISSRGRRRRRSSRSSCCCGSSGSIRHSEHN